MSKSKKIFLLVLLLAMAGGIASVGREGNAPGVAHFGSMLCLGLAVAIIYVAVARDRRKP